MFRRFGLVLFGILLLTAGPVWAQVTKIPANPQKGFQWPYYFYVPKTLKNPPVLLVEPNNTGKTDDNQAVHDAAAVSTLNTHISWADSLGSPYLVPTFPRPATDWKVYTQALDRDSLTTNLPGLVRIDLQLIAMIDDARARLAAAGTNVGPKVWMVGFSGSGSFTNHFVLLHPDRIQAASSGAGGEYATAPISVWKGKTLRFPVGIADLAKLTGQPFDTATFRKVPMQIYIGDLQLLDAVDYEDGYDPEDAALIKEVFGGPHFHRYPASEAAYNSIGSNCTFVVFPGLAHDLPNWSFIRDFLEYNRTEPFPAPLAKPMLYRFYFPHVASFGPWETEISVINTTEVPVHGEWQAFRADGSALGQSIPLTLPPLGRKQIVAGTFFKNPQDIAYLALTSDSGFLSGYTRFSQPGNRASLPAGTGTKTGWFAKMEKDGWTGIAFVNIEANDASVDLTACDAYGNQVAAKSLRLSPGSKFVGMVDQLFSVDLSRATHFRFKSDRNVLGFTVSGSSDGQMLDGLHCLDKYIK